MRISDGTGIGARFWNLDTLSAPQSGFHVTAVVAPRTKGKCRWHLSLYVHFSEITRSLEAKRIGLLREVVPQAKVIGLLVNPNFP